MIGGREHIATKVLSATHDLTELRGGAGAPKDDPEVTLATPKP
jgi:hypothetical protein